MDLGDTLRFSSDVYDKPAEQGGVLVNAPTVALTITLPDGTTTVPSVTNPPTTTGKYLYDYATTTLQGRYTGRWLFTMAGGATTSYVETFDVGSALVTVDEAVAHLRAAGVITTDADLDQLQWLTFVATDAVERDLDLIFVRRTVTSTFDGGCRELKLRKRPPRAEDGGVVTISAVTESGATITDYVLRKSGWRLMRGTYGGFWGWGYENVSVTYTAECVNPPSSVRKVCLNTVQGMWQESQQAFHPGLESFADNAVAGATAALTPVERDAYDSLRPVLMA